MSKHHIEGDEEGKKKASNKNQSSHRTHIATNAIHITTKTHSRNQALVIIDCQC